MKNKYLEIFLQKFVLNIDDHKIGGDGDDNTIEGTVSVIPNNEPIEKSKSTIYNKIKKSLRINKSNEEILSEKIVKAIQDSLYFIRKMDKVNKTNSEEHDKQVKEDIQKIKKLAIIKQIDMLYGGGFIMFDSNFNINQMIYTCMKDGKTSVFINESINTNTENNSINKILQSDMNKYNSKDISNEIINTLQIY